LYSVQAVELLGLCAEGEEIVLSHFFVVTVDIRSFVIQLACGMGGIGMAGADVLTTTDCPLELDALRDCALLVEQWMNSSRSLRCGQSVLVRMHLELPVSHRP
jgi:hypothetical protein